MNKGVIELVDMEIYAYHGCFKEEQLVGNRFLVDVTIETDIQKPAESDNIKDALNYVLVYNLVKDEMKTISHLLENVTERIINRLYKEFPYITKAKVRVSKMNPPMGGQMERVAVTLEK